MNVAGKMAQAERYARGLSMDVEWAAPGLPKAALTPGPMAQASTLRCRLPTHATAAPSPAKAPEASGTWFRDLRHPAQLARPLQGFHTPDGLLDLLRRSAPMAEAKLSARRLCLPAPARLPAARDCGGGARPGGIQSQCLLAMATGTGKTRTIIGLMYRF